MNRILLVAIMICGWTVAAQAGAGGAGGAGLADGLVAFEPPQPLGCVALRVDVPPDKMLVGVRWFNGAATGVLPRVLAASGSEATPPPYSAAVTLAEGVTGADQAWSEVQFATPVASQSGTLFLMVEYPPDYTPPAEGPALGVGFSREEALYSHFVTGDGSTWIRVASQCRVLLEPVLSDRVPGIVALGEDRSQVTVNQMEHMGLLATPNPFNPQTAIALYLKQAAAGDVRIYDLRGHLVRELYRGPLRAGENSFVWDGRDSGGRAVASGAYWVQARMPDQVNTLKVMLLR